MFNPTSVVIDAFITELVSHYVTMFGKDDTDIQLLTSTARNAMEIIANSNAPYHDLNHTVMVTMVGTEILRGKMQMEGSITPSIWVHFVIALLHHDIGYVRGICKADRSGRYTINAQMDTIAPPPGATDAFLTPYHVDRAKLYITERFGDVEGIDIDIICSSIERTRFPIPSEEDHQGTEDLAGLLRAADLIGQLADPQYFSKISRLYAEFKETGTAAKMGYTTAADLQSGYPRFFWDMVSPYIDPGIRYLRRTQEGQAWVANLYANVFTEEHEAPSYGPERRNPDDRRVEPRALFKANELSDNDQRSLRRRNNDEVE